MLFSKDWWLQEYKIHSIDFNSIFQEIFKFSNPTSSGNKSYQVILHKSNSVIPNILLIGLSGFEQRNCKESNYPMNT